MTAIDAAGTKVEETEHIRYVLRYSTCECGNSRRTLAGEIHTFIRMSVAVFVHVQLVYIQLLRDNAHLS